MIVSAEEKKDETRLEEEGEEEEEEGLEALWTGGKQQPVKVLDSSSSAMSVGQKGSGGSWRKNKDKKNQPPVPEPASDDEGLVILGGPATGSAAPPVTPSPPRRNSRQSSGGKGPTTPEQGKKKNLSRFVAMVEEPQDQEAKNEIQQQITRELDDADVLEMNQKASRELERLLQEEAATTQSAVGGVKQFYTPSKHVAGKLTPVETDETVLPYISPNTGTARHKSFLKVQPPTSDDPSSPTTRSLSQKTGSGSNNDLGNNNATDHGTQPSFVSAPKDVPPGLLLQRSWDSLLVEQSARPEDVPEIVRSMSSRDLAEERAVAAADAAKAEKAKEEAAAAEANVDKTDKVNPTSKNIQKSPTNNKTPVTTTNGSSPATKTTTPKKTGGGGWFGGNKNRNKVAAATTPALSSAAEAKRSSPRSRVSPKKGGAVETLSAEAKRSSPRSRASPNKKGGAVETKKDQQPPTAVPSTPPRDSTADAVHAV